MVTLFYIDLVKDIIFSKQIKENSIREQLLSCIIARMNAEGPQSWGQIYLARQLQIHKNELLAMNISQKLLEMLWQTDLIHPPIPLWKIYNVS